MPPPDDYQVCTWAVLLWVFHFSDLFEPPEEGKGIGFPRKHVILADCTTWHHQHLVCRCIVFHRSQLLKIPQETQISKSWRSTFSILLNKFAALSFDGIKRFLCLFSMSPQETHSKVDQRKDMLKFPGRSLAFCKLSWSRDGNDSEIYCWPTAGVAVVIHYLKSWGKPGLGIGE